jgi:hypothetical protein
MPVLDQCLVDELAGLVVTRCDPDSGWALRTGYLGGGANVYEITHNGERCYGVNSYVRPIQAAQYLGPEGPVAVRLGAPGSDTPVFCTKTSLFEFSPNGTPPDAVLCKIERSRPECAAWNDFGYPVGTGCKSETPGSCGDAATP